MSKFVVKDIDCNICGRRNEVTILAMASTKGTADLDFRPAEDRRSAMPLWVHKCGYCRNVFSTSEAMPEYGEKYIDSKEYVNCANIAGLSDLGKRFVRLALIYQRCKEYRKAGDAFLCAAWACDDEKMDVTAIVCRKRALTCYNEVDVSAVPKRELPELKLRITDVLRRAGMFEEAAAFAKQLRFKTEQYIRIRDFQIERAKAGDKQCYKIEEI
ncbi:MAG: hypothetical protein J1E61_07155 [Lachnospiraceae bacterium]|nr:hypothetical protein [Lachnospiraceae bacterium]